MNKYKIFKNKRTKYHPSIEICVLDDGTLENIEIIDSPTIPDNYEDFDKNPNPNSEIKIDVYVAIIKKQRKNGGKLTNEALTQEGHTPSSSIKPKQNRKGKKNE